MRAFALFLGLMLLSLAAIGVLSYPAWLLLHPHFDFPFHRIGERIGMLALIIGFLLLAPRARLADKASLGYGAPRRQFIRELLKALALGVVTMLLVVTVMGVLGLLSWSDRLPADAAGYARLIGNRLLSGIAVGFIEETLLRGAMYTAIARESGTRSAIVLTSIVYAATHFFASFHIAPEAVTPYSGLVLLQGTLHAFADPLAIGDAFLCLGAVGAVLAIIRSLTGNIAACIGLHAGWVWVMLVAHELTRPVRDQPLSFLLSRFDGFVGWLVLGWTIVLGFALYRLYAPLTHPRGE
jgi:membrane protease YdiL (CAAX protease family)